MPFDLAPELNDTLTVLQLRAQWTLAHMARGESSWSFIMIRNGLVDQPAIVWDLWEATCKSLWMERRPTTFVLNQFVVQDRYPGVRPDLRIELDEPGHGSSPDSAPGQVGPVITWRSNLAGRSYRGRTYWGPIMRDDLETGFINDFLIDNVDSFAEHMIDAFGSGAVGETQPQLAVVSRHHNGAPEPIGRFALVRSFRPVHIMGTQRRRLKWWSL